MFQLGEYKGFAIWLEPLHGGKNKQNQRETPPMKRRPFINGGEE